MEQQNWEEIKNKRVIVECEHCKGKFPLRSVKINEQDTMLEKKVFHVIYYVCPHCGKVFIVALEDKKAKLMQKEFQDTLRRVKKFTLKGVQAPESLTRKMQRLTTDMKLYQQELKHRYQGEFHLVSTEETQNN